MFTMKNWEEYTYYLFMYLKDEKLAKFRSDYFQLHYTNQLRFFHMLDGAYRQQLYKYINPNELAPIFSKLNINEKQRMMEELNEAYVIAMIDSLRTDEVIRFLSEINQDRVNYYLTSMDRHKVKKIRKLLSHRSGTAGAMMATEYVTAFVHEPIFIVLERLRKIGRNAETIYYIYVVTNENQLIGVVSLRDLITKPHNHTIGFVMKEQVIAVSPTTDEKDVVKIIKDNDLLLVPVITDRNELIGIITVDDVLDVDSEEVPTVKWMDLKKVLPASIRNRLLLILILCSGLILR